MKYSFFLGLLLLTPLVMADALSDRLAGFSTLNESQGDFVETLSASYLSEPLISRGTLSYKRPGQLSKLITSPVLIEQQIKGNQLSITQNDRTRSIQLSSHPELAVGIFALQAILDGNKSNLHQHFEIRYNEISTGWTLWLTPKNPQAAKRIEEIILQGKDNSIRRTTIQYHNGDTLITDITHGN
jgi:outer membrane lipoprotein-sorting protein